MVALNKEVVVDTEILSHEIMDAAIGTLLSYSETLSDLSDRIDANFCMAVETILAIRGHVIITGVGKSGLIGRKIAATLASTGTPSFFVHSTEAFHGDLGMITGDDLAVLISNSGETEEVVRLLPVLRRFQVPTLAIVGKASSTLARRCDIVFDIGVEREACPLNLAPTTSTLATLAIGDALAVALMKRRRFAAADFARFHPGGALGRRLFEEAATAMVDVSERAVIRA